MAGLDHELFECLEIGVAVTGVTSHRIELVNPAACAMLGRPESELLGATWDALVPSADVGELLARAHRRCGPDLTESREIVRIGRPDGSQITALVTSVVLASDEESESCLVTQIQDVDDREAADQRLQLVLGNSPVSMSLMDRSGRLLFRGGGHIGGSKDRYRAAETATVFDSFADQREPMDLLRQALRGVPVFRVVKVFGRYLELHLTPIEDEDGNVTSVASVATDVTDRERARAEQAVVADLAQHALDTVEPNAMWQYAASTLSKSFGATVTVHDLDRGGAGPRQLDRGGAGPRQIARIGPPAPPAVTAAAVQRALRAGELVAYGEAVPAGRGSRPARTWSAVSAPVGRPGAPTTVITLHRPDPRPGPTRPGAAAGGAGDADQGGADQGGAEQGGALAGPRLGPFSGQEEAFLRAVISVLGSAAVRFAMEDEIRHRSLHDSLTDLPNRDALLGRLRRSLARDRGGTWETGLIFVDLDGFKIINDTFGHQAGDEVLLEVADRLRSLVRPTDVVARLAGDEFAVLCDRVASHREVERVARRVIVALAAPIAVAGTKVTVTASAGVALSGADLADAERLLNASDVAMYAAKRGGASRYAVHHTSMRHNPTSSRPDSRDGDGRRRPNVETRTASS